MEGLKVKILNQVRNLSMEAGGKGSGKKDLNSQRNLFRDVLAFIEVFLYFLQQYLSHTDYSMNSVLMFKTLVSFQNAECPETSVKLQQGAGVLVMSTWAQLIQVVFVAM